MQKIKVGKIEIGKGAPLAMLCGPCVIENEDHTLFCASHLRKLFSKTSIQLIFKASYDKANRSSIHSFRGPGIDKGLKILERVQKEEGLPVVTDVHSPEEAKIAGSVCDMIQIPAFLCRQTDLLIAAAQTPAAINVKKGQFLAPWDMKNVAEKIQSEGCQNILLTDRGTSFGYNNLVTDFRGIEIMQKQTRLPVCYDASHSVQLPGGLGNASGGQREFIPLLSRAAIAAGVNALFLEAHPDPSKAKSDAATVFPFDALESLLDVLQRLYDVMSEPCFAASL